MNGFADRGLDEDAFGEKSGNIVQAFDYFRKFLCYDSRNCAYCLAGLGTTQLLTCAALQPKQNLNM